MSRIGKTAKTLARILVPGAHLIPFAIKNKPNLEKNQTDGIQTLENYLIFGNAVILSLFEGLKMAAYATTAYYLLK